MTATGSPRSVQRTRQFKRDYRRERQGRHRDTVQRDLARVIRALATDQALKARHRDPALSGAWKDCRDCHLRPDLVLIYRKRGSGALELIRMGSHSEIGL